MWIMKSMTDTVFPQPESAYSATDEHDQEKQSSAEKLNIRQRKSTALLNNLEEWLEKNVTRLVPDRLIHKAMSYALNQWPRLASSQVYLAFTMYSLNTQIVRKYQ